MSLELCSSMLRTKSRVYFIFNWRIIALQCYAGFCHITTHISHNYMCVCVCARACVCVCVCILFLLSGPPVPSHLAPRGHHQAGLPALHSGPTSCLFHSRWYTHVSATLAISPTLSFPHCVPKSILHDCKLNQKTTFSTHCLFTHVFTGLYFYLFNR